MRRTIVSIGLYVPYVGVPHAGGEYVRRHFHALCGSYRILAIAPQSPDSDEALRVGVDPAVDVIVSAGSPFWSKGVGRILVLAVKYLRGASISLAVERMMKRDAGLRLGLTSASLVEFQFLESASTLRWVRRMAPQAVRVIVVHDVLHQRWGREIQRSSGLRRCFVRGRYLSTRWAEKRYLRLADCAVVFSDKDARLVREIAAEVPIEIVPPALWNDDFVGAGEPSGRNQGKFLFAGALNRAENHEGAIWLIENVWPLIVKALPSSHLTIAGANPMPELVEAASRFGNIDVTGYVPDLDGYYRSSDVFLSPVFRGAGVKFKNIIAMTWGLPVVTTPVGAEGIGELSRFACVTDDPSVFAQAALVLCQDYEAHHHATEQCAEWARHEYGDAAFGRRIRGLYAELIDRAAMAGTGVGVGRSRE